MKHLQKLFLSLLLAIACIPAATAQCSPPGNITTSLTHITCRGSGQIAITGITDSFGTAISTDSCNYTLYNATNTILVRPAQSSAIFNGLDSGTYNIRIRRVCTSPAGVSEYYTSKVTLTGYYYDPLMGTPTANNPLTPCSHDGKITAAAVTKGVPPYTYCLVDSINAPLSPTHYVAPPQSSNVFTGLNPGTYFLRMYDACGASLIRPVTLTAPGLPAFTGVINLVRNSCDTVEIRATVFPYTTGSTLQRTWITYPNGATDTVNLIINNGSYIPYRINWSGISGSSATFTLGYKDICGNIQTTTKTVNRPNNYMSPAFTAYNYNCTSGYFVPGVYTSGSPAMNLLDSNNSYYSGEKYYFQSYSTDSGATWKPYNINDTLFLNNGTSTKLFFKWCNTVYSTVLSASPPAMGVNLYAFNKVACAGKAGFYIHKPFGYVGNIDSVLVEVIARPAGQDSIPPFFDNWTHSAGLFPQLFNLVPGTYTLRFSDKCTSVTNSITIAPNPYSAAVIKPRFNCANTINLYLADSTAVTNTSVPQWWRRYFAVYNSAGVNVYNFSYPYGNEGYTIGAWSPDLPPDNYTIRTWKASGTNIASDPTAISYSTDTACGADTIRIDAHMPPPLSMKNVLFTTCSNDSLLGSIIAVPTGGISPYSYSLYHDSLSAATLISGAQPGNIFNNLIAGTIYVISVQDQCGSSTPARSGLSNTKPVTTPSSNVQPCTNDAISLSVDSVNGLTYQWTLNGINIPGATHPVYSITSMGLADSGTYVAKINSGNCLLLANPITLDPSQCGNIILPLNLLRFSGGVNAQSNAVLHWDIASAVPGAKFEILYSTDGSRFMTAGTVWQNGVATSFGFVHKDYKVTGRTYYRLLLTNEAGERHYSSILALDGGKIAANQLSAFPVPFVNTLDISYTAAKDATVVFTISDISGRNIQSRRMSVNTGVNNVSIGQLDALPSGNYLLSVTDEDGNRQTMKIQK